MRTDTKVGVTEMRQDHHRDTEARRKSKAKNALSNELVLKRNHRHFWILKWILYS